MELSGGQWCVHPTVSPRCQISHTNSDVERKQRVAYRAIADRGAAAIQVCADVPPQQR